MPLFNSHVIYKRFQKLFIGRDDISASYRNLCDSLLNRRNVNYDVNWMIHAERSSSFSLSLTHVLFSLILCASYLKFSKKITKNSHPHTTSLIRHRKHSRVPLLSFLVQYTADSRIFHKKIKFLRVKYSWHRKRKYCLVFIYIDSL